jgi:hypothetical protein
MLSSMITGYYLYKVSLQIISIRPMFFISHYNITKNNIFVPFNKDTTLLFSSDFETLNKRLYYYDNVVADCKKKLNIYLITKYSLKNMLEWFIFMSIVKVIKIISIGDVVLL